LLVDDGLDKEDILGQIDDQEGERIIGSACVEICEGEVGGEESSAQLSPEKRVQGLVEGLSVEEANLEITDADITESALADFSGYQVALAAPRRYGLRGELSNCWWLRRLDASRRALSVTWRLTDVILVAAPASALLYDVALRPPQVKVAYPFYQGSG
jgi:hypothetical protein